MSSIGNEVSRLKQIISDKNIDCTHAWNLERKLEYIASKYSNSKEDGLASILRTFFSFGDVERKFQKDLYEFDSSNFSDFFREVTKSRSTFVNRKSLVKYYLKWCYDNGIVRDYEVVRTLEGIQAQDIFKENVYKKYYFPNFMDLFTTIELKLKKSNKADAILYSPAVVAVFLAWYGVKLPEVVGIKKTDIDFENAQIHLRDRDVYIKLGEQILPLIKLCIESKQYINSDYLIRAKKRERLTTVQLTPKISALLGGMAGDVSGTTKLISYNKVYWSGVFVRAYKNENPEKPYSIADEAFKDIFAEDTSMPARSVRLKEYRDFCDYFFSKQAQQE